MPSAGRGLLKLFPLSFLALLSLSKDISMWTPAHGEGGGAGEVYFVVFKEKDFGLVTEHSVGFGEKLQGQALLVPAGVSGGDLG